MKEFIIENFEAIITLLTMGLTYSLGKVSKLSKKISNNLIPIQNMLVMLIASGIYYWATGDFSMLVASGSPLTTLFYDAIHSIKKEKENE